MPDDDFEPLYKRRPLLSIEEVPVWLRFNPFIRTGYRPPMTVREALLSLFSWHNETVNVWLHVVGAVFFFYLLWISEELLPGAMMFKACLGSIVCVFGASCAYHLMMPCCTCQAGYHRLVNCDVLSCMLSITTTGLSFTTIGYRCASSSVLTCSTILLLLSAAALGHAIPNTRTTAAGRVKLFGFHCLLRLSLCVVIVFPKVVHHGFHLSFYYHVSSFFLLVGGGMLNGLRIPERWLPEARWMDCALNSHNLWHYLCVVASASSTFGCMYDVLEYDAMTCN